MKVPATVLLLAILAIAGCRKEQGESPKPGATHPAATAATAPLDYLAAQGRAKNAATRVISIAEISQAIQKFQAIEDRFPRDLNELVQQHYLQAIPTAPAGSRLDYDAGTGTARFVRISP